MNDSYKSIKEDEFMTYNSGDFETDSEHLDACANFEKEKIMRMARLGIPSKNNAKIVRRKPSITETVEMINKHFKKTVIRIGEK